MIDSVEQLKTCLQNVLGARIASVSDAVGQVRVETAAASLHGVCQLLRDDPSLAFAQLTDVCGVDYSTYGAADWQTQSATSTGFSRGVGPRPDASGPDALPRFAVVYHLLSIVHNWRLRVRVFLDEQQPRVATVTDIWPSADWFEREAFDMFGILFDGHPDLRRLLTDYGFSGHPFRKDFPLEGHVEVRYDEAKRRVVYQPVSIESRVLVPRVIRAGSGHAADKTSGDAGA
jgi:NADH-quinone oxidoreductase subunit C